MLGCGRFDPSLSCVQDEVLPEENVRIVGGGQSGGIIGKQNPLSSSPISCQVLSKPWQFNRKTFGTINMAIEENLTTLCEDISTY